MVGIHPRAAAYACEKGCDVGLFARRVATRHVETPEYEKRLGRYFDRAAEVLKRLRGVERRCLREASAHDVHFADVDALYNRSAAVTDRLRAGMLHGWQR